MAYNPHMKILTKT